MCVLKQLNWPHHPVQHQSFCNCAVHSCAVVEVSSLSGCSFCVCSLMCVFWLCLSASDVCQHLGSVFGNICVVLCGISRVNSCPEDGLCEDQPRLNLAFTGREDSRKTVQAQLGSDNAMKLLLPMSLFCSLTSASQHGINGKKLSIWFPQNVSAIEIWALRSEETRVSSVILSGWETFIFIWWSQQWLDQARLLWCSPPEHLESTHCDHCVFYVSWACDGFFCCSPQIQVSSWGFVACLPWSQCLLLCSNWGIQRWSLVSSAFLQLFSVRSNDGAREEKVNLKTFHQSLKLAPKLKMQCLTIRNRYCGTPFGAALLLNLCVGQWIAWLPAQIRGLKLKMDLWLFFKAWYI